MNPTIELLKSHRSIRKFQNRRIPRELFEELIRAGQSVRLEVDALPDLEIAGRVVSISPGTGAEFSILPPENATGNFTKIVQRIPVRIAIDAPPEVRRLLVPGMSVVATVDTRNAAGELEEISSRTQ